MLKRAVFRLICPVFMTVSFISSKNGKKKIAKSDERKEILILTKQRKSSLVVYLVVYGDNYSMETS